MDDYLDPDPDELLTDEDCLEMEYPDEHYPCEVTLKQQLKGKGIDIPESCDEVIGEELV